MRREEGRVTTRQGRQAEPRPKGPSEDRPSVTPGRLRCRCGGVGGATPRCLFRITKPPRERGAGFRECRHDHAPSREPGEAVCPAVRPQRCAGRPCSGTDRTGESGPPGPGRPIVCQSDRGGKGDTRTHTRAHAHTHTHTGTRARHGYATRRAGGTLHRPSAPCLRGPGCWATVGQPTARRGCLEAPEDVSMQPYVTLRTTPWAERELILANN